VDKELLTMLVENVLEDQGVDMASYRARKEQAMLLQGTDPNAPVAPGAEAAPAGVSGQTSPPVAVGGSGVKNEQGNMIPGVLN
jgi:hypothetical protein